MKNDLIKRGLAISYAVSGIIRRIDGEEWIRTSDVRQSLNGVPAEPQDCSDCKLYDSPYFEIKIDEDQLQELVDKAKAEVLASIERPQGEWIPVSERLPEIATACIVQLTNGYITMGKYHSIRGGSWVFIDTTIQFVYPKDSVIAWQPLPEPYKEEGEEQ